MYLGWSNDDIWNGIRNHYRLNYHTEEYTPRGGPVPTRQSHSQLTPVSEKGNSWNESWYEFPELSLISTEGITYVEWGSDVESHD